MSEERQQEQQPTETDTAGGLDWLPSPGDAPVCGGDAANALQVIRARNAAGDGQQQQPVQIAAQVVHVHNGVPIPATAGMQPAQGEPPAKPLRKPGDGPDWESIEFEWNAGQLSVSEIGRIFGVSHTAINKRAAKHNWPPRPVIERFRRKVMDGVVMSPSKPEQASKPVEIKPVSGGIESNSQAVAVSEVETETSSDDERTRQERAQEAAIEVAATRAVGLILEHQSQLGGARAIIVNLFNELAALSIAPEALQVFAEIAGGIKAGLIDPGTLLPVEIEDPKKRERAEERARVAIRTFSDLCSLNGRAQTMQRLADAVAKTIGLEREAHGIVGGEGDGMRPKEEPIERRLARYREQGMAQLQQQGISNAPALQSFEGEKAA